MTPINFDKYDLEDPTSIQELILELQRLQYSLTQELHAPSLIDCTDEAYTIYAFQYDLKMIKRVAGVLFRSLTESTDVTVDQFIASTKFKDIFTIVDVQGFKYFALVCVNETKPKLNLFSSFRHELTLFSSFCLGLDGTEIKVRHELPADVPVGVMTYPELVPYVKAKLAISEMKIFRF